MGSEPEPGDAPGPPTEHLASDGGATLESALVVGVGVCAAAFGGSYVATHGLGETVAAARETVHAFSLQIASMGPSGYGAARLAAASNHVSVFILLPFLR